MRLCKQKYGLHLIFNPSECTKNTLNIIRWCLRIFWFVLGGVAVCAVIESHNSVRYEFFKGFWACMVMYLLSRSLGSIVIFKHVIDYPNDIEGMVYLKGKLVQKIALLIPLIMLSYSAMITFFMPTLFMFGATAALVVLVILEWVGSVCGLFNREV